MRVEFLSSMVSYRDPITNVSICVIFLPYKSSKTVCAYICLCNDFICVNFFRIRTATTTRLFYCSIDLWSRCWLSQRQHYNSPLKQSNALTHTLTHTHTWHTVNLFPVSTTANTVHFAAINHGLTNNAHRRIQYFSDRKQTQNYFFKYLCIMCIQRT